MNNVLLISVFVLLPITLMVGVILIQTKRNAKRQRNEMMSVYKQIVDDDHLMISEEEILADKILAVDPLKKVFVFVHNQDQSRDEPVYDIISLSGLSGCQVEKKGTSFVTKYNGHPATELHVNEVHLSFMARDSVFTSLRVYNAVFDGQQDYLSLTKTAENWQQKLNKLIKEQS